MLHFLLLLLLFLLSLICYCYYCCHYCLHIIIPWSTYYILKIIPEYIISASLLVVQQQCLWRHCDHVSTIKIVILWRCQWRHCCHVCILAVAGKANQRQITRSAHHSTPRHTTTHAALLYLELIHKKLDPRKDWTLQHWTAVVSWPARRHIMILFTCPTHVIFSSERESSWLELTGDVKLPAARALLLFRQPQLRWGDITRQREQTRYHWQRCQPSY